MQFTNNKQTKQFGGGNISGSYYQPGKLTRQIERLKNKTDDKGRLLYQNLDIDTIIEIEEVKKREKKQKKLDIIEQDRYIWVRQLNEIYNKRGQQGVINEIKRWNKKDPIVKDIKEFIEQNGVVKFMKVINNQYLKVVSEAQSPVRSRVRDTRYNYLKKLRVKSNKDLEKEESIANTIENFVNNISRRLR